MSQILSALRIQGIVQALHGIADALLDSLGEGFTELFRAPGGGFAELLRTVHDFINKAVDRVIPVPADVFA